MIQSDERDVLVAEEAEQLHASVRHRAGPYFWLPLAGVGGILALLVIAVMHPAQGSPLWRLHRPAPDFTMSLYGRGTLHLAALRGKTVVLNFWWSGCIPCQQEAPLLERQW